MTDTLLTAITNDGIYELTVRCVRSFADEALDPVAIAFYALQEKGEYTSYQPGFTFKDGSEEAFKNKYQKAITTLAIEYRTEELKQFIFDFDPNEFGRRTLGELSTPLSLCQLAAAILDIKESDTVADPCCGYGAFLVHVAKTAKAKLLAGTDISQTAVAITKLKLHLLGVPADILCQDMLSPETNRKFDKVFTNFPFGYRTSLIGTDRESKYYNILKTGGTMGKPSSADWVFNRVAFDLLNPGGKAVTLTTSGAMYNGGDARARKYFIDNGMIQAVIALPERLFRTTTAKTTMVILGQNSGPIRMIDASDFAILSRRWIMLDPEDIQEIAELLITDAQNSKLVQPEEIAAASYNLYPPHYLGADLNIPNPVLFSHVIKSIGRGTAIRANKLDMMTTNEDTGYQYVSLSDISDGMLNQKLTNIVAPQDPLRLVWIKDGDLVLSKNGAPFKAAVAEVAEGQNILAGGNLYVVSLDTNLVDPYYLAAFLNSATGKEALSRISAGTTLPSLPLSNLRNMHIPLLPQEQQQEIALAYKASLEQIEVLNIKIEKARIAAAEAYEMAVEPCQP